uniref:FLYWCH-type domain-containing protein n=1 Tax=Meloidogyne hapla TaxID=6305 RepID=A0A1I8BSN1_MELHA
MDRMSTDGETIFWRCDKRASTGCKGRIHTTAGEEREFKRLITEMGVRQSGRASKWAASKWGVPIYLLAIEIRDERNAFCNNVTMQCEQKRKEFCNEAKNKYLCSFGQPYATIWHGIMIKTEYIQHIPLFVTTITLSLSNKEFVFIK